MNDWQKGFKQALIDTVVRIGSPVRDDPSFYGGWTDYGDLDWPPKPHPKRQHVERIGIDYDATTWTESHWGEFMGTFHEGDTTVYGIDLDLVLNDGTKYHWRCDRRLAEFITEVVRP